MSPPMALMRFREEHKKGSELIDVAMCRNRLLSALAAVVLGVIAILAAR
jgi:hypothetical protein